MVVEESVDGPVELKAEDFGVSSERDDDMTEAPHNTALGDSVNLGKGQV
jgi:hypothetical protein